ncbi:MAG: response regulator transcription factor [Actinomycetota bacterium]
MRLLVVEDSVKMAGLLRRGFAEEGHAVDVAPNGEDALWMATENPYDAVVLDVVLDGNGVGPDGFEICRRLREAGTWAPVLMLTARDAVDDRVRGLDAGADDYLTKPFSFEELNARIRALLRRGREERPTVLEVGDLRLDPARHEASRKGTPLDLTAKEFVLLEYLMRHPDVPLTRMTLLEHLWDFAFDGGSNVIDVHVRNLRVKLARVPGSTSIETVRGVGYRLRDGSLDAPSD